MHYKTIIIFIYIHSKLYKKHYKLRYSKGIVKIDFIVRQLLTFGEGCFQAQRRVL